ncbi:hypothetical protein OAF36_04915 [Akkermansiaceae bacterium]|nr:hypothetical protein [Akkermansiaceae bacterium]
MKRLPIIFVVLSLPLYLLDQVTKWWVVFRFREPLSNDFHTPDEHVAVIDGFLCGDPHSLPRLRTLLL